MRPHADLAVGDALKELMADSGLSFRILAKLTRRSDPSGKGLSSTYLNAIVRGEQIPAQAAIKLIAAALDVSPSYFAEYRLAEIRREFDDRTVGLDDALLHLEELLSWLPGDAKSELADRLRAATSPAVVVVSPTTHDEANRLARRDPSQFDRWALNLVGATPTGVDDAQQVTTGRIRFRDAKGTKHAVVAVLRHRSGVAHVRSLRAVMERERAELAVLVTLREPTLQMRIEAGRDESYASPSGDTAFHRIQILTIRELLNGKTIDYPRASDSTSKKARKTPSD